MKSSAAAIHQIYFSKLEINTRHEQSHSVCWNSAPKQGAFCWIPSWLLNQFSYQKCMGRSVSHTLSSRHGLVLGKHASSKRRIQPFATALWVRWEQVPAFSFSTCATPGITRRWVLLLVGKTVLKSPTVRLEKSKLIHCLDDSPQCSRTLPGGDQECEHSFKLPQ